MEHQKDKFTRFMSFWIDYQKFKGASALCAMLLNLLLLIFKLAVCVIVLLVCAPHLGANNLLNRPTLSILQKILYVILVIISLAIDIPLIAMSIVGVVGFFALIIDAFTTPGLIVPAIVTGALGAFFCYITVLLIGSLFVKNKTKSANEYNNENDEDEYNDDDYSEKAEEATPQKISIDAMSGTEFEHFCADILHINGYTNVRLTAGSGDQGVDIIAHKEEVKYAIQCKHYSSPVGNTPVQEVNAGKAIYNCHIGVVLTNSIFTKGAEELAKANNVLLWDRCKLYELIKNAGLNATYQ